MAGSRVDVAERVCSPCGVMEHDPQRNQLGQPVGWPIEGWSPRQRPPRTPMIGRFAAADGSRRRRLADLRSGTG